MESIVPWLGLFAVPIGNVVISVAIGLIVRRFLGPGPRLLDDYKSARVQIDKKGNRSWLERWGLHCVYAVYYSVDAPTNLARVRQTKGPLYSGLVDGAVVLFTVTSTVASVFSQALPRMWLVSYFLWRVAVIVIGKIQSLTEVKESITARPVSSFSRMVFILFLNIIELTVCYVGFYMFLGMLDSDVSYLRACRIVLGVFLTEGFSDGMMGVSCWSQNLLLISQYFIVAVFFLMFTANLVSLRYQQKTMARRRRKPSRRTEIGNVGSK